jgi:hypothetical protein
MRNQRSFWTTAKFLPAIEVWLYRPRHFCDGQTKPELFPRSRSVDAAICAHHAERNEYDRDGPPAASRAQRRRLPFRFESTYLFLMNSARTLPLAGTLGAPMGARTGESPAAAAELSCAGALLWPRPRRSNCQRTSELYPNPFFVETIPPFRSAFARWLVGAAWPGQVYALLEAADSPHARVTGSASVVKLSRQDSGQLTANCPHRISTNENQFRYA